MAVPTDSICFVWPINDKADRVGMKLIKTDIEDVVIVEPEVYGDSRGYFFESFSKIFNLIYIRVREEDFLLILQYGFLFRLSRYSHL